MSARRARQQPNADRARLAVLASAGDDGAFLAVALDLLASPKRLDREAALEALVAKSLPAARDAVRAAYLRLDADGPKLDQGALQRLMVLRILRAIGDPRDADIAMRACDTTEILLGDDTTWRLRSNGLMTLVELAPDVFPYHAAERLDDVPFGADGEPANTAFQLLAATGHQPMIYRWLLTSGAESVHLAGVFELFTEAPPAVVRRFAERAVDAAIKRQDEALSTVLAEAIVKLDLEASYPALVRILAAKISDELYSYIAMLLAGTNRPPLLAILEQQLRRGRRPRLVADALRIRPTPEQQSLLDRWERGELEDEEQDA